MEVDNTLKRIADALERIATAKIKPPDLCEVRRLGDIENIYFVSLFSIHATRA